MKEAVLYQRLDNNSVRCNLCAQRCLIKPGKRGLCSVRENRNGLLYSLVYGLAMAANIDPIEKKPLFHFLPGSQSFSLCTAGCNFRCRFCQNWQESQISKGTSGKIVVFKLPPAEIVRQALSHDCRSISYTYTEPTVFFEYAIDTAKLAKKKGLVNIFVTNGYQTPETIKAMTSWIDAANVDLKSFSDEFYRKICGGRLAPVLESIRLMHQAGVHLEITTLVVPGQNDSDKELTQIADFLVKISPDVPWHLSRFHPNYQMPEGFPTPLATLKRGYQIGKKAGLNYVYLGNVITEDKENTYCPSCGNLAIKRIGYEIEILGVDQKGKCNKCGENLKIKI